MSPTLILGCIAIYFAGLLLIAWITSRNANNASYFLGNKQSPWYLVAFGLIGDSLSGVTYISVPGAVGSGGFSYLQLVFGYFFGYLIISYVLLPVYYRMNLTSIYSYLRERFGFASQKTGSFFFLLSRLLGAAARLYLAAEVLQTFVFQPLGIPFAIAVSIIIILILIYTYKGGIKTLVWTDSFQSAFLLLGVLFSIVYISNALDYSPMEMVNAISKSDYSKTFFWNINETNYFWKQFLGGMFIAIAMTGLDQNMMQKNLSCPSLKDAQKNINSFSIVVVLVNVFFVSLGALLYIYASQMSIAIPERTDQLFPLLALNHLGIASGLVFIIGLTAATFSSADSVLTTLTTSFYIDFLKKDEQEETEAQTKTLRHWIHVGFAILLLGTILVIKAYNNKAIIDTVFMIAGYTYGPLLGLFFIGIFTQLKVKDSLVPIIAILAPFVSHSIKLVLDTQSLLGLEANNSLDLYTSFLLWIGKSISGLTGTIPAYKTGNEFLILNGVITCLGLWLIAERKKR